MNCHLKATHIALCPYLLLTHHSHHHCATGQRWLSVTYPHHSGHEWSLSALMDLTEIVIMLWLIKPYSGAPAGSVQAVFFPHLSMWGCRNVFYIYPITWLHMCSQDWCVSPALSIQMFHFVVLCSVIAFMTAHPMLPYGHIISDGLIIQSAKATDMHFTKTGLLPDFTLEAPMHKHIHLFSVFLTNWSAPATQTFTAVLNTWFSQPVSMFWCLRDRSSSRATKRLILEFGVEPLNFYTPVKIMSLWRQSEKNGGWQCYKSERWAWIAETYWTRTAAAHFKLLAPNEEKKKSLEPHMNVK